ncbi:UBP-type zinc finger domain-containing protein [Mycobacteroides abscessus]|nr:UBP-type zinc finger domain-containing protein [Mycobacteroides abscessus]MDM2541936.1 UBP-type zinc finger domain-containing protein [Mycobacteroides abscessus]
MKRLFRRGSPGPAPVPDSGLCPELAAAAGQDPRPRTPGACEDCAALGEHVWAHLRMCLQCGRVSCCDSSPHQHATAHFHATGHPVMRSHEPGEDWRWCYVHSTLG